MGENIADLGGALVALDAYHHLLGETPAPVIDGLTGDQRFFLDYAQSWREKSTSNGVWYDHAVIPPDRSSIGVSSDLSITAEIRIREILERGENGVPLPARADGVKLGSFYLAFMDEARAEVLDFEPIAPLLKMIRAVGTREDLAELMGTNSHSLFNSVFSLSIDPDDRAPGQYAVSIGQGDLGLDHDYYVTPQLADKKSAYLAYVTQVLTMIGWEAPERSAAAVLSFETSVAKVSWTNRKRRDPEKTYNPVSIRALAKNAPFPWRRFLASADLDSLNRVVMAEKSSIPKIAAVYARTSLETLKAWQSLHLPGASRSHSDGPWGNQAVAAAASGSRPMPRATTACPLRRPATIA